MLHQAPLQPAGTLEQWQWGMDYWKSCIHPDSPQANVALDQWSAMEKPLHAVAYDVTHLSPTRWEVIRILDDESVWMQCFNLETNDERLVVQAAIVSSHRFNQIA